MGLQVSPFRRDLSALVSRVNDVTLVCSELVRLPLLLSGHLLFQEIPTFVKTSEFECFQKQMLKNMLCLAWKFQVGKQNKQPPGISEITITMLSFSC